MKDFERYTEDSYTCTSVHTHNLTMLKDSQGGVGKCQGEGIWRFGISFT
jgi:hypothetical protein